LKLLIQPFDQLIQFIIAQDVSSDQIVRNNCNTTSVEYAVAPKYMDLSGMGEIKLVFKNSKATVDFKLYTQTQQNDLTKGQVIFRISQNKINEIRQIFDSGINVFYITSTMNTLNTVIYSGLFNLFDDKNNVNDLNNEQKQQESETGNNQEPSIISVVDTPEKGTAVVTRRLVRDTTADYAGGGTTNNANANTTNANTAQTQNLNNSSTPTATKQNGITYEIDSSSNLKIDGYTWTPADVKKALSLTDLPTGLSIKDDVVYTKDKMLEKLTVLKGKLESLLQNKEDKDKYKQTQSQTRKEIGTDQEFAYYNLEFGGSLVNTTTSNQTTTQTIQTDYKVYNQTNGSLVTTISKMVAEDLKVNDLTKILGKSWIIKSIDKTIREIKVVQDTGSTARPGGPV